ncbi:hypothetical protein EYB26_005647 [Talaromyces marneffei]|uniref:uncharacterized protein n=1 Tax=Talaromyces marneffei TaxID=37727 RepID=UPI0012A7B9EF|nr:uncharacterized protein EYB26_005647 [Talaromyces marneffei]QGA17969.1 hypothetical protein EYB26_005647 [Talaromyces marneffei]
MAFSSSEAGHGGEPYDLVCVGFGPASLAIAIALHDALENANHRKHYKPPRICFLEKQQQFAWHAGMMVPGSKMQISFIKDLATLRDPRSEFTFLNYLKSQERLVDFTNLGTFLPSRLEFGDYMRWCASRFVDVVIYGQEVVEVTEAASETGPSGKIESFIVKSRDVKSGQMSSRHAKNVIIAVGGKPRIPPGIPHDRRILHSSSYCTSILDILRDPSRSYHVAVLGSGQSAAEIFHDLYERHPNVKTTLIMRESALRPSDDSPFVNEIFNPERIDGFYATTDEERQKAIASDRATNYGVVRMELIEQIYHDIYMQKVKDKDQDGWQRVILPRREIVHIDPRATDGRLAVRIRSTQDQCIDSREEEVLHLDALIVATGYTRSTHEELCAPIEHLKPLHTGTASKVRGWKVNRNYSLVLDRDKVSSGTNIWLQGCNESTHGISDSLLSVLATRSGEIVESIFGEYFKTLKAGDPEKSGVRSML